MGEYYIDGFQDYLETLCTKHKLLAHDSAPGGKKSFVRFHSPDDLDQAMNNQCENMVIVSRFYGKTINGIDDHMMRQYIQIRFLCYAKRPLDGTISEEINVAIDRSFTIMMDFIARMHQDMRDDLCGPLRGLELDNCSWDELPEQPTLEHHFGWDLTLPFRSNMPGLNNDAWFSIN